MWMPKPRGVIEIATSINRALMQAVEQQLSGGEYTKQKRKLGAIGEIPLWIDRAGTVADWGDHYEQADEDIFWTWDENELPSDPFDRAIYELLNLIGLNMYVGFDQAKTIAQYERLRHCLEDLDIESPELAEDDLSCW